MSDEELMAQAKRDFQEHFGPTKHLTARMDYVNDEPVVIVEAWNRRVVYSIRLELIKISNLEGDQH